MKREENYKAIGASGVGEGEGKQAIEELRNEVLSPLESDIQKLRDPLVLAAIMHTAASERENTNRLLRTLIEKLDAKFAEVDARLTAMEKRDAPAQGGVLLPSQDEGILAYVRGRGHASAEEVRRRFGYKGRNAASARLSHMHALGLLEKKQVGRAVLYISK